MSSQEEGSNLFNNSNNNKTTLEKKNDEKKEKKKTPLHEHAKNAFIGIHNYAKAAHKHITTHSKTTQENNTGSTQPRSIAEAKQQKKDSDSKNVEQFVERSLMTVLKILTYCSIGVDLMMFSEYYNKNNVMQGINPNKHPYVDESREQQIKAPTVNTNQKGGVKKSAQPPDRLAKAIDRTLLGYRDSWQFPWKNRATKEYPNVAKWGLTNWMLYYVTKVCARVIALSRNVLYMTFKVSSRIWNPKSHFMNALYLLSGYVIYTVVLNTLLMKGIWAAILTGIFALLMSGLITKNWCVYKKPAKPEDDSIFYKAFDMWIKFLLIGFLWLVMTLFNSFYLVFSFMFMFFLTPFMGDFLRGGNPDSKYNFRQRFVELMWKNRTLISLICMATISIDAYKTLGKDPGYVFIGFTIGLFIAYLFKILGR